MWNWTKSSGGILGYDFTFKNHQDREVEGIPLSEVKKLFPKGKFKVFKITLTPQISRFVCRFHTLLYTLFATFNFLRTHILCFIKKIEGFSKLSRISTINIL
jgi:hypothetical protein